MLFKRLQSYISHKTKRIFIIPTLYGVYFLLTLFVLFLISLSFGHSLAFTTTFIFFSLIMVSAHFTNYNINKVEILSIKAKRVVAGEVGSFEVLVHNNSNKWRFDLLLSFVHTGESELFTLAPFEKRVIKLSSFLSLRGLYQVEKMRVYTTFPFGLFYSWSFKEVLSSFICLPKSSQENLELPHMQSHALEAGDKEAASLGGSDEFLGHINYRSGMPPKGIDWKAFARGRGKLFKQFIEYGGSRLIIDFNHVSGNLEEKIEKVSNLIEKAEQEGAVYSFSSEAQEPIYGRGEVFKIKLLEELALYKSPKREML
jgi:uncharacterized protein (DUF58 family)